MNIMQQQEGKTTILSYKEKTPSYENQTRSFDVLEQTRKEK
jgi:hypothetical protein